MFGYDYDDQYGYNDYHGYQDYQQYEYELTIKRSSQGKNNLSNRQFNNNGKTLPYYVFLSKYSGQINKRVLNFIDSLFNGDPANYLFIYNINNKVRNGKMKIDHEFTTKFNCVSYKFQCSFTDRLELQNNKFFISDPCYLYYFRRIEQLITGNIKKLRLDLSQTNIINTDLSKIQELHILDYSNQKLKENLLNLKNLQVLNINQLNSDITVPQYVSELTIRQQNKYEWRIFNNEITAYSVDLQNFDLTNIIFYCFANLKLSGCRFTNMTYLPQNSIFYNTTLPTNLVILEIHNNDCDKKTTLNLDYFQLTQISLSSFSISFLRTNNLSPSLRNCNIEFISQSKLNYINDSKLRNIELKLPNLENKDIYLTSGRGNTYENIKLFNIQRKLWHFSKVRDNDLKKVQLFSLPKSLLLALKIQKIYDKINSIINE